LQELVISLFKPVGWFVTEAYRLSW